MKNCNMMLNKTQKKYLHYHLEREKILSSNQKQMIKQAKFAYSPLGKTLEKQTEQQVGALKSLEKYISKKTY